MRELSCDHIAFQLDYALLISNVDHWLHAHLWNYTEEC